MTREGKKIKENAGKVREQKRTEKKMRRKRQNRWEWNGERGTVREGTG